MVWKEKTAEEKTIELEKIGKVIETFWEVIDVDEIEKVYLHYLHNRNRWFTHTPREDKKKWRKCWKS